MESEILGFLFSYGCSYTVGAEAEREVLQTLLQKRRKLLGQEELEVSPQVGSFETAEKGAGFRRGQVAQQQALSATSTSSSSPVAATELATAGDTTNAGTSEDSVAEQQEASSTASTAEVAPDGGETAEAARKARLAKVPPHIVISFHDC